MQRLMGKNWTERLRAQKARAGYGITQLGFSGSSMAFVGC
jgi:hypothetical protein